MKNYKRIKRLMSSVLLLALIFSCFGGIAAGPDAQAAYDISQIGKINCKVCNFDARGYDYDEVKGTGGKLYTGYPVTLMFKRKTGCRIPKGSYAVIMKRANFDALRDEGKWPPAYLNYAKYYSSKYQTKLNYNECSWTWNGGWKLGKYVVMLVMPCISNGKSAWTYQAYNVQVKNYG